jgi:phosphate transport system substrate-binding protein
MLRRRHTVGQRDGSTLVAGNTRRGARPRGTALRRAPGYALGGVLALTLTACASTVPETGTAGTADGRAMSVQSVTLKETGSTLLYPLMKSWAQAYAQHHPGVTVTTAGTGSGAGIAAASKGAADIGATDAYLSSGDLVKNPSLLNIPLAVSAQAVVYNLPTVSSHVNLNGTVLAEIYQGKVTTWNDRAIEQLNPGVPLPPIRIVPLHREDSSGDTFLFASYLSTQDAAWNSATGYGTLVQWPVAGQQETGNAGMVAGCKATPGCLAYIGISYLGGATSGGLGEARLANNAGSYELPDAKSVSAALSSFVSLTPPDETISLIDGPAPGSYPVVNYEYAVVSTRQPSAAKAAALKNFLTWAVTTGNTPAAAYLGQVGFQPLPPALVTLGELQIQEITGP